MPNKIVELQVAGMNGAAQMLDEVHAKAAARLVRETANDYARVSDQRSELREMLKAIIESPTPALLRKARELVEGDA